MTQKSVLKITGVDPRTLDYWVRSRLIKPATRARGTGSKHHYGFNEVMRIRFVVMLRRLGLDTSTIAMLATSDKTFDRNWLLLWPDGKCACLDRYPCEGETTRQTQIAAVVISIRDLRDSTDRMVRKELKIKSPVEDLP